MKRRSTYRPLIALTIFAILVISSNLFGQLYRSTLYKVFVESRNTIKVKFSYSPFIVVTGIPVRFFDRSGGNPSAWTWDFGDGTQSNDQNPSHIYENAGVYAVSFTVTLNGSPINTIKKVRVYGSKINSSNKDNSNGSVRADFSYNPPNPTPGTQVQFADKSLGNITSWSWKFGDGGTSTQKNPAHSYSLVGSYIVTLAASDGTTSNSMTQTIKVADAIIVDFYFSPDAPAVNQAVQFIDKTYGTPTSWSWDFGDGGKSTAKNPTHTYSQAGAYTVKLVISDGTNSSTKSKSLTVSSTSTSKVITASSCALADVQAAIAQAKPGDTVIVPNGTARWTSTLIIDKGVILKAATPGGVTIVSDSGVSEYGYGDPANFLIAYVPSSDQVDKPFRLSGFVLDGNNNRFTFMGQNNYLAPVNRFRLDHCEVKNSKGSVLIFYGEIYGVIDNNVLRGGSSFITRDFGLNERSWSNFTFDFGTGNNRYYEDNVIYLGEYSSSNEGGLGGRYCVRYNTFHHLGSLGVQPWFDMHGNGGTGGNHGTMGAEIYENVVYCNNKTIMMFDQRGGKLIAFNNSALNVSSRAPGKAREESFDYLNPPETNPAGQPQHVSESYYWNQSINGSVRYDYSIPQTVDYGGATGVVPRWDVHCFKQVENFDGSSGVGVGPISKRPAYCATEGVAWWATDENRLYRWHNGVWELYYVPYTYPHPLRTTMGD